VAASFTGTLDLDDAISPKNQLREADTAVVAFTN